MPVQSEAAIEVAELGLLLAPERPVAPVLPVRAI